MGDDLHVAPSIRMDIWHKRQLNNIGFFRDFQAWFNIFQQKINIIFLSNWNPFHYPRILDSVVQCAQLSIAK